MLLLDHLSVSFSLLPAKEMDYMKGYHSTITFKDSGTSCNIEIRYDRVRTVHERVLPFADGKGHVEWHFSSH
jgi:hypothetical protein